MSFCWLDMRAYVRRRIPVNVGAINWGLVAGKTQTIYPWGWHKERGEPDVYFHDIFHPDGTWLYPGEARVIKQVTGVD